MTTAKMKPLSPDTPLEVERVWLDEIRKRGPAFQLQRMIELTSFCRQAAREAVRRALPDASEAERDEILLRSSTATKWMPARWWSCGGSSASMIFNLDLG